MSDDAEEYRIRSLQMRPETIAANHARMVRFGAYCLVKAVSLEQDPAQSRPLGGYFTMLGELSGLTPGEMRDRLGLRAQDLATGAAIYQMQSVPVPGDFLPRGYSSLPDGLPVRAAAMGAYPPGQMAWQAVLRREMPMRLMACVVPGQRFEPGPHPRMLAMYGR